MKAVRFHEFGGEEVLRLEEIPSPIPADGEVLVRMGAAAVNPGDLVIRAGYWDLWPIPRPFVLGAEGAGTVVEGKSRFKSGDKVIVSGSGLGFQKNGLYAEFAVVPEAALSLVPQGLSLEEAAAVPIAFLTAHLALTRIAKLQPGEWTLVTGASGGVGGAGVQIAKALGAKVITTVGSQVKYQKAIMLGADHVIDLSVEKMTDAAQRITDGRGADAAFDSLGGEIAAQVLSALAPGGRLVMAGYSAGMVAPMNVRDLMKPASVHGFNLFAMPVEQIAAANEQILGWLAEGKVKAIVGRTFPLAQAAEAHRYLAARQAFGKVVLTM